MAKNTVNTYHFPGHPRQAKVVLDVQGKNAMKCANIFSCKFYLKYIFSNKLKKLLTPLPL